MINDHECDASRQCRRLIACLAALLAASSTYAQNPSILTQDRFDEIAAMAREQQRAPDVQQDLVNLTRHGTLLYMRHLDKLAVGSLFSLGDEARFMAAIGSRDGTDHNRIYIEGRGSPMHFDGGEYVFPVDFLAAYTPSPARNTYWHEANHALLDTGGVGINPRPYAASMDTPEDARGLGSFSSWTSDYHHPFIEGVGQRGAEAYDLLHHFERTARRAFAMQSEITKNRRPTFAEIRNLWAEPHHFFSRFTKAWERVALMPEEALAEYRAATGVFFSAPEDVANLYREGGLKSGDMQGKNVGDDVVIPKWVFYPTLIRMPVYLRINEKDHEPIKENQLRLVREFTIDVFARASLHELDERPNLGIADITRVLQEGKLRVRLEGGDPQAGVRVELKDGEIDVVSARLSDVTLNGGHVDVTFVVPDIRRTKEPTTYTLILEFHDDRKEPLFDTSERRILIQVKPPESRRQQTQAARPSPGSTRQSAEQQTRQAAAPDRSKGHWKLASVEIPDSSADITLARGHAVFRQDSPISLCVAAYDWVEPAETYGPEEEYSITLNFRLTEFQDKERRDRRYGGCRINGQLRAGHVSQPGAEHAEDYVRVDREGNIVKNTASASISGRFPPVPPSSIGGHAPRGSHSLNVMPSVGRVTYNYEWVHEAKEDELEVAVIMDGSTYESVPLPQPYTAEPIAPEELTGPRPPISPPDEGARPRLRPTVFQPPGGDYRITIPAGWRPVEGVGGEHWFASPQNAYVLVCPPRSNGYRGEFSERRSALAAELMRRGVGTDPRTPSFGRHEGLHLTELDRGRMTNHVYVASEGRAVGFRMVSADGVSPTWPSTLDRAFSSVEWVDGGPAVQAPPPRRDRSSPSSSRPVRSGPQRRR